MEIQTVKVPFSLAGLPWSLCNHVLGEMKVTLVGYDVTMEMTGTEPTNRVPGAVRATLVRYDVTMETAGHGSLSSNHSSYHPGKKGERKLICQQLQGHVTATNSVLVCVSTVHEYLLEPL